MLFNSIEYAILLAVVFFAYWGLSRLHVARSLLLVVAGFVFYASWNAKYLFLLLVAATVDYFIALAIARTDEPRRRRFLMALSVVIGLGNLCAFKYFNFFVDSFVAAAGAFGVRMPPVHLGVLLPVGISFYTFETISYSIDVYRRKIQPTRNYLHFLLFVSFFPHLVAGPIVRGADFLPQLDKPPTLPPGMGERGLFLVCLGLLKKVAIADFLAVNLVDRVFDFPDRFTSLEVLAGVYGYAVQIYCDFSGYSDIAIGSALLLGLRLTQNFDAPYRAVGLQDFWRRWHMSLSSWLRDYLYISLGGSRGSAAKTYRNLALTMLLGGLWHGASWTFVIWGALHGGGLAVSRAMGWDERAKSHTGARRALAMFLTFQFVCLAWVFFRARTFMGAITVLTQIGSFVPGHANLGPKVLLVLGIGLAAHYVPDDWMDRGERAFGRLPSVGMAAIVLGTVAVVAAMAQSDAAPFIYFQF